MTTRARPIWNVFFVRSEPDSKDSKTESGVVEKKGMTTTLGGAVEAVEDGVLPSKEEEEEEICCFVCHQPVDPAVAKARCACKSLYVHDACLCRLVTTANSDKCTICTQRYANVVTRSITRRRPSFFAKGFMLLGVCITILVGMTIYVAVCGRDSHLGSFAIVFTATLTVASISASIWAIWKVFQENERITIFTDTHSTIATILRTPDVELNSLR